MKKNPKKKPTVKQLKKLFIELGFLIRECKVLYYYPKYGKNHIDDNEYDQIEEKYKKLAKILKEEPHASNQVGANMTRLLNNWAVDAKFPMIKKYLARKKKRKRA